MPLAADAFDELWVWDDPALAGALTWYRAVAGNRRPAKFRIAAGLPVSLDLAASDEDALWAELERLTPLFLARQAALREGAAEHEPGPTRPNLLDLCVALSRRMLAHCNFCAWDCGVDRSRPGATGGKTGACKLAAEARVSSAFHHPGEELVYRGRLGSGTIFFTSCNMRCAFCQNGDISTDKDNGMVSDARTLAALAWLLRLEGCHNVNWVGGEVTIHLHAIVEAIALLGDGWRPQPPDLKRALGVKADHFASFNLVPERGDFAGAFNAPMLWNSNFYMSGPAMRILRVLTDVWLPDFKFGPGRCAVTLARTPKYWQTVTGNLTLIRDWGEDLTVRHLVMPGHVECCTYPVLEWLAEHMPAAPVNVMDQYHPDNFCDPRGAKYDPRYEAIARRPSRAELEAAYARARVLRLPFETVTFETARSGIWG